MHLYAEFRSVYRQLFRRLFFYVRGMKPVSAEKTINSENIFHFTIAFTGKLWYNRQAKWFLQGIFMPIQFPKNTTPEPG